MLLATSYSPNKFSFSYSIYDYKTSHSFINVMTSFKLLLIRFVNRTKFVFTREIMPGIFPICS